MKKKLILALLIVFLPIFVKGYEPVYCSKEDYEKVLGSVQKVVFAPEVVKSTKEYTDYKINSNVKRDDKIFIDTIIEVDKSEKVEYVEDTRTYRIYGKNGTKEKVTVALKLKPSHICYPEKLKNIDYDLLYINPYAKNKKCKVYPDFKYCGKNTYLDKDEKEVDKLLAAYAKEQNKSNSISTSNQKNNDKKKSILKHIIYFLKKNIVLILAGFILLIVFIMVIKSKKRKNLYSLLLIFLFPCIISASSSTSWVPAGSWTGSIKPCPKERQQAEIREWCNCTRTEVDAAKNPDNGNGGRGCGSYGTSGPARICGDCYGFCFGPGLTFDEDLPRVGINKETDFDQEFGSFCNGREYELPVKLPGYCCYYKGNRNSKYRYYNGPTNSRCKPNMVAIKIDDPTDCQNTTCDDYRGDFKSQEQFCNEYADTTYNKNEVKKQCISQSYAAGDRDMRFCNLPIRHTEKIDESCRYNSHSNASDVFSAKGRKKNSRVFGFTIPGSTGSSSRDEGTVIYLEELCEYEENLEMRSSGARYAFLNTLTINNGRNCKYKIYNGKNILRNQMATVFRPNNGSLSCSQNKYCQGLEYIKKQKLETLLKGNKTNYSSDYTLKGKLENGKTLNYSAPFKYNNEALKAQSDMSKAKDTGEQLVRFNLVNGGPTVNFERENTAVTAVTMNMKLSCYNFKNNVLGDGTCFPSYFAERGVNQVKSNATFDKSKGFLCDGSVNKNFSFKDNPSKENCPNDDGTGDTSSGYLEYSPFCEIIVHAKKCDDNPHSNIYDLTYGYRAGLKINGKIRAKSYLISNHCVNKSRTEGQHTSTLKGTKQYTHIFGGVIDDKGNFYHCQKTLVHDESCPGDKRKCTITKSGNNYTVGGPSTGNLETNGVYVRKGTPFLKYEYKAHNSPKNLKMFRIFKNPVNSTDSAHLKYYRNNNLVNMAEPAFRHSIYFMVCPNNKCDNPYFCDSDGQTPPRPIPGEDPPVKPKPDPKDYKVPDCMTDIELKDRRSAENVRQYCKDKHSNEYGTDGTVEACLNKCFTPDFANEPQIYRRINYGTPFPNNRQPGWNWLGRENLITESEALLKNDKHKPLWTITLKQSDSYSIRNRNKISGGYDPYYDLPGLESNPFQAYRSNFLRKELTNVKITKKNGEK